MLGEQTMEPIGVDGGKGTIELGADGITSRDEALSWLLPVQLP